MTFVTRDIILSMWHWWYCHVSQQRLYTWQPKKFCKKKLKKI